MTSVNDNIHQAIAQQAWHRKVMLHDPVLTPAQSQTLLAQWQHAHWWRPLNTGAARIVMHLACTIMMAPVRVVGREHLPDDCRAIVVSNHFAPLENLAVRKALGNRRLFIVSELTNLAMSGVLGWLMRNADTVPIAQDLHYLGRQFPQLLAKRLQSAPVLIYPEQAMWPHYRKPRPGQIGAYHYAAMLKVPVISLFVEQTATGKLIVHVLNTLTPDPALPLRQAAKALRDADDAQRQAAYTDIYHRPYTLADDPRDFA
ncbi:lysophospholipid acyltransferase family protein [Lacticaseibacillus sp. GG6-2]